MDRHLTSQCLNIASLGPHIEDQHASTVIKCDGNLTTLGQTCTLYGLKGKMGSHGKKNGRF